MTMEQTAQAGQAGPNPGGYPSAVPTQIRFPVRSRKAAAEEAPELQTSREALYLAPAHEAVLSLTSPDDRRVTGQVVDRPESESCGPGDFISTANRAFKLPLTITAVPAQPSENGYGPQCAVSSAGTDTGSACLYAACMRVQNFGMPTPCRLKW